MPETTFVIPEDYPIEGLDQWAELITAAAGAGMQASQAGRARKSAKRQEAADVRMMAAQDAAAKAAELQTPTASKNPWLIYTLVGVGVVAVGITVILLVKK